MKKRFLGLCTIVVLCLVLSITAWAAGEDLVITGGTLDTDYTYADGVLTVKTATALKIQNADGVTTTTDRIVVQSGVNANITLAGVNIDVRGDKAFESRYACAFEIKNVSGTVTVTLADDTENTLISGYYRAGLEKNDNTSTLVITCEKADTADHTCSEHCGKLTALSFDGAIRNNEVGAAAGIGSAWNDYSSNSVSNIMIKGGTIIAESYAGAGIGSGLGTNVTSGDVSEIRITGGIVYATSVNGGAIGSGDGAKSGNVSDVTITNSTVTLTSKYRGIGSGYGRSASGTTESIHITNSSVKYIGSGSAIGCTPDNGAGADVYLLTIENPSGAPVTIDGQAIPTAPHGDDLTRYAYVTGEDHIVCIGTTHQQAKFDSDKKIFTWENVEHEWSAWVKDANANTHTRTCQIVGCGFTETKEHTYTNGVCICGDVQYNTTVTFDADGGSVRPTSLETGADGKLTSLPTPTRRDYNFNGWFTKDGAQVTTDTVFTESTTVYAQWTVKASALLPTWQEWELIDKIVAANKKKDEVVDEPEVEEPTETEPTETEPEVPVDPWNNPFTDVSETDAFYEAVKFAYENGYMNGMSDDTFAPNDSLTRAMLVTVLYRAAGSPVVEDANPFADVAEDAWYHNAVVWAKSIGLVNGISATEFAPEDELTREQLVTIFYRYAAFLGYDLSIGEDTNILSYEDFDAIAEYAIPALQWACGAGLIESVDGNILPQDNATRALVAVVLLGMFA